MGVNSHGGKNSAGMPFGQLRRHGVFGLPSADDEKPENPRLLRPAEDILRLPSVAPRMDVAVGIDEEESSFARGTFFSFSMITVLIFLKIGSPGEQPEAPEKGFQPFRLSS
ncbi:hypothetical protein MASR2M17_05930 [Aminivibrio sp.]